MSVQVFPGATAQTTITLPSGRTYTCLVGAVITVPDADALELMANGWWRSAHGTGTTANRPTSLPGTNNTPLPLGFEYFDTTLTINMIWNGKNWVRHDTGVIA
jgi:hypothetical protein